MILHFSKSKLYILNYIVYYLKRSTVLPALGPAWADIPNMRIMLHRDESVTDCELQVHKDGR